MIRRPLLALAMACAVPTSAMALVETELSTPYGPPVLHTIDHPLVQARLSRESLAWLNFSAQHPRWQVRWQEVTGTPFRMWGDGLDLGRVDTAAGAEQAARTFISEVRELMGVELSELRLVVNEQRGPMRFVTFQREVGGVPVEGALVQLWFKYGKLIMVGLESHPAADLSTQARLAPAQAVTQARAWLGEEGRVVQAPTPVILPLVGSEGLAYVLTLRTRIDVDGVEPGQWYLYVDAFTGEVLHAWNDVRYAFSGTISGGHEERTIGDPVISSPLPYVTVNQGRRATTTTDAQGAFSLNTSGSSATLTTSLKGPWFLVRKDAGTTATATFSASSAAPSSFDWGYGTSALMSETNVQWHSHVVRDRALRITPDLPELQERMIANVDINSSCNAFYNGWSINFFRESGDCNDTGRISDVIYHEYGHHYHHSLVVTGVTDGAVGEGSGDYLSATIVGDSLIGPGFFKDGGGIRDLEPNMSYPDDLVGEVHADGLIWGGAMWDLRARLIADLGERDGVARADFLFAHALMSGPTLSSAYEAVLLADDDNGDLADGTPLFCEITEEFGLHGLGPGVGVDFIHEDSPTAAEGAPIELGLSLSTQTERCLGFDPASARVLWSLSPQGPFEAAPMEMVGGGAGFTGRIPAQRAGTLVYYTFSVMGSDGVEQLANRGRSSALYQTWVGPIEPITCEDFEASDGGYTHSLDEGEPGDGADDWMWGSPAGAFGDPGAAASGNSVWGNDLGPEGYNGAYQPNKVNHLSSVAYSTVGVGNVVLRYRRWLNVEDGAGDQATIYVGDVPVWQNESSDEGNAHTEDQRWVWHYVPLGGLADNQASVVVTWELATNASTELGGWNIDDVCLMTWRE